VEMPTIGEEEVVVVKKQPDNKGGEEELEELPDHDVEVTSLNEDVVLPTPSLLKDSDQNENPFAVLESAPSDLSREATAPESTTNLPLEEEHEEQASKQSSNQLHPFFEALHTFVCKFELLCNVSLQSILHQFHVQGKI